jgi:hypothetical protein
LNRRLTAIVLFVAAQAACPTSAFAEDFATIIPMKGGGTYVTARFGDTTFGELMVDTGSGYTTINEQTLASLKEGGHAQHGKVRRGDPAEGMLPSPEKCARPFALPEKYGLYKLKVAATAPRRDRA